MNASTTGHLRGRLSQGLARDKLGGHLEENPPVSPHETGVRINDQRKRMLDTLRSRVDPAHTALIVIDIQNDFCAAGGMMDNEGLDLSAVQEMAGRLPDLIDAARAAGVLVVFVRNVYSTAANWYLSDAWLEQAERKRKGSYVDRAVCAPGRARDHQAQVQRFP
jgi:Isochorismatase family